MTRILAVMALLLSAAGPLRAQTPAVVVEYYHLDALGSVRAVTNESGQVLRRHDYHPFGHGDGVPSGTDPRRFTGKERDAESGLDYFGARYYASRTGRFTSVDPVMDIGQALVEPQLWNRYAYVTNNPLRFVDPDGRQREAALDRDVYALLNRQITVEEYHARIQARGVGAAVGAALAAGPLIWRAVFGCSLSPSCQSGALDLLEGAAGGSPSGSARLGQLREEYVAQLVGGRVAGDVKVTLHGVGSTAIDVYGKAGEFIGVGGPMKAIGPDALSRLGTRLKVLAAAAEEAGVKAQYFFARGTPVEAFRLAEKWLGKGNVHWYELPQ
jgi:RHS repeat-associated protein